MAKIEVIFIFSQRKGFAGKIPLHRKFVLSLEIVNYTMGVSINS